MALRTAAEMPALLGWRGLRRCLVALLAALWWTSFAAAASASDAPALNDGSIVLFRHADAPGVGDPPGFVLGDCRTQRNLGEAGRRQARRIGEQFRQRGVVIGAVLTSEWCRARETAELAFPGSARVEPAFNSFFDDRTSEPAQTARALSLLERWRGPGVLVVFTHQVNISALTGVGAASGEGVVVRVGREKVGQLEVLGRLKH